MAEHPMVEFEKLSSNRGNQIWGPGWKGKKNQIGEKTSKIKRKVRQSCDKRIHPKNVASALGRKAKAGQRAHSERCPKQANAPKHRNQTQASSVKFRENQQGKQA